MSKEIENIKFEIERASCDPNNYLRRVTIQLLDIKSLLSSLEKEKERADKAEKRLEAERISVNELCLANQELVEKVKELDDRIEKLVILIDKYAERITKAEERIKELEAQLASIKADSSISKLEVEDNFGEDD